VLGALAVLQHGKARPWDILTGYKLYWAVTTLLMGALGIYYLSTIARNAGASTVGRTNWQNGAFLASEGFGFPGLGPGRLELRAGGASALRPYIRPLLEIAIPTAIVAVVGLRRARFIFRDRRGLLLAGLVFTALTTVLAIGVLKHFRVLGR